MLLLQNKNDATSSRHNQSHLFNYFRLQLIEVGLKTGENSLQFLRCEKLHNCMPGETKLEKGLLPS